MCQTLSSFKTIFEEENVITSKFSWQQSIGLWSWLILLCKTKRALYVLFGKLELLRYPIILVISWAFPKPVRTSIALIELSWINIPAPPSAHGSILSVIMTMRLKLLNRIISMLNDVFWVINLTKSNPQVFSIWNWNGWAAKIDL